MVVGLAVDMRLVLRVLGHRVVVVEVYHAGADWVGLGAGGGGGGFRGATRRGAEPVVEQKCRGMKGTQRARAAMILWNCWKPRHSP